MSEPGDNPVPSVDRLEAFSAGIPAIVTQTDADGRLIRQIPCMRVGQLALHENMLLFLEGDRVKTILRLGDLQKLSVHLRPSFRRPVVGAVFGTVLLVAPISVYVGDPFQLLRFLNEDMACVFTPFLVLLGAYTLFELFRRRTIPWVIATTRSGSETEIALESALTAGEQALLTALSAAADQSPA